MFWHHIPSRARSSARLPQLKVNLDRELAGFFLPPCTQLSMLFSCRSWLKWPHRRRREQAMDNQPRRHSLGVFSPAKQKSKRRFATQGALQRLKKVNRAQRSRRCHCAYQNQHPGIRRGRRWSNRARMSASRGPGESCALFRQATAKRSRLRSKSAGKCWNKAYDG